MNSVFNKKTKEPKRLPLARWGLWLLLVPIAAWAENDAPFIVVTIDYATGNYINRQQVMEGPASGSKVRIMVEEVDGGSGTNDLKLITVARDEAASANSNNVLFEDPGQNIPTSGSAPFFCTNKNDPLAPTCSKYEREFHVSDFSLNFELKDGFHTIGIYAEDLGGEPQTQSGVFFLDQYAPCDNGISHTCEHNFIYNSSGEQTKAVSDGTINLGISLNDGLGAGLISDGSEENLKVLVTYMNNLNKLETVPNRNGADNTFLFSTTAGQDCDAGGFLWTSFDDVRTYNYSSFGGFMYIEDISLLKDGDSEVEDGTYWVFVCTKDRAENWTFVGYPSFSEGASAGADLCKVNPLTGEDDTGNCYEDAGVPALRSRVFHDGPVPDFLGAGNPATCFTDPCKATTFATYPLDGSYTSASSVEVVWKNPKDLSGIHKVYYKLSNIPPINITDMVALPREQWKRDGNGNPTCATTSDPGYECFDLTAFAGGTLYLVVEDAAGNVVFSNYTTAQVNIDRIPPNSPIEIDTEVPQPTLLTGGIINWRAAKDNGPAGLKEYHICWNKEEEFIAPEKYDYQGCGAGSKFQTIDAAQFGDPEDEASDDPFFELPPGSIPFLGRYLVTVWASDKAGNQSISGTPVEFIRSDGLPLLNYTRESKSYEEAGVDPPSGTDGEYTFRVRYSDFANKPPVSAQVWLDFDGNGYDAHEKFAMERVIAEDEDADRLYIEGATYTVTKLVKYPKKADGNLRYLFVFANGVGSAQNGENPELDLDPTSEHILKMDPYDFDNLDSALQVRNGMQKGGGKKPVALLALKDGTSFQLAVFDMKGRRLRKLVDSKYDRNKHRYTIWNLKDKNGRRVAPGIYMLVLTTANKTKYGRVFVGY